MNPSGGPPGLEMPRPTAAPLVVAAGLALVGAGVALSPAFGVVGGVVLGVGLVVWIGQWAERGVQLAQADDPRPAAVTPDPAAVPHLRHGMAGYRLRLPVEVHPVSAGIKGGLVGGLLMPLPALAWAVLNGHSVWYPLNLLAGIAMPGVDAMAPASLQAFHPTIFALGVALHGVMSLGLGLLFGVLLPTLPAGAAGQLAWGAAVFPTLWTGLSYGLMGVVNPLLQRQVDWPWFIASQFVFGLAATLVVRMTARVRIPPAGAGPDTQPLMS
jgi:hypothetical protein